MSPLVTQDPRDVTIPVVGGHAGITILPLLSQVRACVRCVRSAVVCAVCASSLVLL